jgi:glycosyltransferase involved in cell wall biosynthesis
MAAGTPVVTTSFGNEGIGAVPGRDLLIADSPELIAEAVVNVLSDRGYADRIAESGQEYIRKHYDKEAVFARLESIYEQLTTR